jgi:hypothetical protein
MEKINTKSIFSDFQEHIEQDFNERILFSAPFGKGKSTFLNDFFDTRKEEYITVKLYPINYSVASNNDVFELIKYDILFDLMASHKEKINLQKEDFSKSLVLQNFMINKMRFVPLAESIIAAAPLIGKPAIEILKEFKTIYGDYKKFEAETRIDETNIIKHYFKSFEKHGIHEMDDISDFIKELVKRCKKTISPLSGSNLKTVLIVDDLDRLDPEQIFRLFNIFSSHYENISDTNKFGFDKIIFVCDLQNIKKIYAHRYGEGVDFSGYIDKFFSTDVFTYDNTKYLEEKIRQIFSEKQHYLTDRKFALEAKNNFSSLFIYLTSALIQNKQLTLRQLRKTPSINLPAGDIRIRSIRRNFSQANFDFLVAVNYLKSIYVDLDVLKDKINVISINSSNVDILKDTDENKVSRHSLLSSILIFYLDENKVFDFDNYRLHTLEIQNKTVQYKFKKNLLDGVIHFETLEVKNELGHPSELNLFKLFNEALTICIDKGYIK